MASVRQEAEECLLACLVGLRRQVQAGVPVAEVLPTAQLDTKWPAEEDQEVGLGHVIQFQDAFIFQALRTPGSVGARQGSRAVPEQHWQHARLRLEILAVTDEPWILADDGPLRSQWTKGSFRAGIARVSLK